MRKIPLAELPSCVGDELGVTPWFEITQERISQFADVTMDHQWMHVDIARAHREMGGTIAHGLLIACLLPMFQEQLHQVTDYRGGYSYGFGKLRFTNPVRPGQRVRLHQKISKVEVREPGWLLTLSCRIDIDGVDKPALVADYLAYYF